MAEQFFTANRSGSFFINFQQANGAASDITGRQHRFRLYPNSGSGQAALVDLPHGTGAGTCEIIDAALGRIRASAGTLGAFDPSYATCDITRTDTNPVLIATWPARIGREGEVMASELGDIQLARTRGVIVILSGIEIIIRELV